MLDLLHLHNKFEKLANDLKSMKRLKHAYFV